MVVVVVVVVITIFVVRKCNKSFTKTGEPAQQNEYTENIYYKGNYHDKKFND